jgi:hypothetical protein
VFVVLEGIEELAGFVSAHFTRHAVLVRCLRALAALRVRTALTPIRSRLRSLRCR